MANGLAWKPGVRLDDVAGSFTPGARIAFLAGNVRAVIARLHRRNATARPLTRAGPWHVVLVDWSPNDRGPPTGAKEPASPAHAPRDGAQRPARPPPAAPPPASVRLTSRPDSPAAPTARAAIGSRRRTPTGTRLASAAAAASQSRAR
jgi:hypothetical protein